MHSRFLHAVLHDKEWPVNSPTPKKQSFCCPDLGLVNISYHGMYEGYLCELWHLESWGAQLGDIIVCKGCRKDVNGKGKLPCCQDGRT